MVWPISFGPRILSTQLGSTSGTFKEGNSTKNPSSTSQLSSCSAEGGTFQRYFLQPCKWIYGKFLLVISKVFFCFDFKLGKRQKIEKLEGQLRTIRSLKSEYEAKQSDEGFKEWWKEKFETLDHDLQKRFFIQGIITLWVSRSAKWPEMDATAKYEEEEIRSAIVDFIRDLKEYQVGFKSTVYPKTEILAYFQKIDSSILQKISTLKK